MKEYIKLFEGLSSADGYIIEDIPFTSTVKPVGGVNNVNLRCNEENKKLEVNGDKIEVVDDGPTLISFTTSCGDAIQMNYQAESGMTWLEWIASEYNTAPAGGGWGGWFRYGNEVHYGPWLICENDISDGDYYGNEHEAPVLVSQTIIPNHNYGIYYWD